MVLDYLARHVWLAVLLWLLVYAADYGLTIWGAREFRRGPMERINLQGSYEANPLFQKDVDGLRLFGPRFWLVGAFWSAYIVLAALASPDLLGGSQLFEVMFGGLVLTNMTQVIAHIEILARFRALAKGPAFEGTMEYSRTFLERQVGVRMLSFALLYLLLAVLLGSLFAFGGAIFLALAGARYISAPPSLRRGEVVTAETVRGNLYPPKWHPDPTGRHGYRYWDGERWTDDVADDGVAARDPYRA